MLCNTVCGETILVFGASVLTFKICILNGKNYIVKNALQCTGTFSAGREMIIRIL